MRAPARMVVVAGRFVLLYRKLIVNSPALTVSTIDLMCGNIVVFAAETDPVVTVCSPDTTLNECP